MLQSAMKKIIEAVSLWGSVLGSTLLALHIPVSGWAFIPYLLSNAASIYLLRNSNASKAIEHQCYFFVFINIVGIIRWLM